MTLLIVSKVIFVIGGFLCYLLADGCTYSIGILYTEFLSVFHQSKTQTAVLPGLIYALPQISAVFICPFVDTFRSDYGAYLGAFLLFISFFVSQFVISFQLMYFTMGFITSLGLELTYVSGIMAVTKGFSDNKYMGLALGITTSGSGIGVFIFNPLLNYLITTYTWHGTMMIESGIFLNVILAGILFKVGYRLLDMYEAGESLKKHLYANPLAQDPEEDKVKVEVESRKNQQISNYNAIVPSVEEPEIHKPMSVNNGVTNGHPEITITHSGSADLINTDTETTAPRVRLPRFSQRMPEKRASVVLALTQTSKCEPYYNPILTGGQRAASFDRRINYSAPPATSAQGSNTAVSIPVLVESPDQDMSPIGSPPTVISQAMSSGQGGTMVRLPVDEHGAPYINRLSNLFPGNNNQNKASSDTMSQTTSVSSQRAANIDEQNQMNTSTNEDQPLSPKDPSSQERTNCQMLVRNLTQSFLSLCSSQIWCRPQLIMFLWISSMFAMCVVIPWTFSFDQSLINGIGPNAASLLVSIIGAGSCIGQIGFGLASEFVPAILIYSLGSIFAGICTILMRWISHYPLLVALHFLFGMSQGVAYALFSVIIVKYVGLDLYSPALSIYLLFSGCANLIGTTISGFIYDRRGSYALAYDISGYLFIIIGFISIPLVWLWFLDIQQIKKKSNISIVPNSSVKVR